MSAQPMTVNFSNVPDMVQHPTGNRQDAPAPKKNQPRDENGKLLTAKQIRARARRRAARLGKNLMTDTELSVLYKKPVEEWDLDELAHGRPRNSKGHFRGPNPRWITSAVHEEAMQQYTAAVKTSMRATTVDALQFLTEVINNDEVDEKGKPHVAASVKLDAAKFLLEHVVGKPTQRIESDVSVKLQGILGQVMMNPAEIVESHGVQQQAYSMGHFPGITMAMSTADDNEDTDDDDFIPEN